MESREFILEKLRATSRTITPLSALSATPTEIFSDHPTLTKRDLFEQFSARLSALKGEVFGVSTVAEAATVIADLCRAADITSCIRQPKPLIDQIFEHPPLSSTFERDLRMTVPISNAEMAATQIGFSAADALVARTGSVVLRSTTAGGRRLSVLPPVHCVIASRTQLVLNVGDWIGQVRDAVDWSFGGIITGPSRTADIEKILVLGAHGPKRLLVIVIG